MEKKTSIWTLNFAFFLSILLHVYIVFFLNDFDINLLNTFSHAMKLELSKITNTNKIYTVNIFCFLPGNLDPFFIILVI